MQTSHRVAGGVGLLAAFSLTVLFACGDGSSSPPSGQSGDFAGRVALPGGGVLYLECRGQGRPTVILESGLRDRADIWRVAGDDDASPDAVFPKLANFTRVCAYDRPGTTLGTDRSDAVPMPRSAADAVDDLHQLLAAARVSGPYVLVGHSTGGLIARLYAASHPDQVVGLVLVDAIAETMQTLLSPEQWAHYNRLLLVAPPPELASYRDLETIDFDVSFAQIRAAAVARPLPPLPFAVLSKGQRFALPPDLPSGLGDAVEQAGLRRLRPVRLLRPIAPRRRAADVLPPGTGRHRRYGAGVAASARAAAADRRHRVRQAAAGRAVAAAVRHAQQARRVEGAHPLAQSGSR